jgi:hypothetical protein
MRGKIQIGKECIMETVMGNKKVANMTLKELRDFIIQTICEFADPDSGLDLRPEVEKELKDSLLSESRISAENAAKKLGLEW